MSQFKFFLSIVKGVGEVEASVHRELNTVHAAWEQSERNSCIGLLHAGFSRPVFPPFDQLKPYFGRMLVTASIKWAFSSQYKISDSSVFEITDSSRRLPCYLALNCFGYEAIESEVKPSIENIGLVGSAGNFTESIVDAVLKVLMAAQVPLSKEEVFANIIEYELLPFYIKEPVLKLGVILNRFTYKSNYTDETSNNLLGKTADGKYYPIDFGPSVIDGWVYDLGRVDEDAYRELVARGVTTESTYLEKVDTLPEYLLNKAANFRFEFYRHKDKYLPFKEWRFQVITAIALRSEQIRSLPHK